MRKIARFSMIAALVTMWFVIIGIIFDLVDVNLTVNTLKFATMLVVFSIMLWGIEYLIGYLTYDGELEGTRKCTTFMQWMLLINQISK